MKTNYSRLMVAVMGIALLSGTLAVNAFATETDDRIEASAKGSYVYKTYLQNDAIRTQSKDGVVTLTGTVTEESHKAVAQETVASLPGVTAVNNQLIVKSEYPDENSDGWVGLKVKTALLFHRNVNAFMTEVGVKDGVVTLKGEASSQAQKDLAGEYAKDVAGVKDVRNEMTIAPVEVAAKGQTLNEKIDDASITAQVKIGLMAHNSTSAIRTSVATSEGVVTINGVAKNDAEKVLVTKLANDIKGVISVINHMTIAEPVLSK